MQILTAISRGGVPADMNCGGFGMERATNCANRRSIHPELHTELHVSLRLIPNKCVVLMKFAL